MVELLFQRDDLVLPLISHELGIKSFGTCVTIGFVLDGALIGGVVYNNFHREPHTDRPVSIEATIATTDPRWASRRVLRAIFTYPFAQLGVKRLGVTIRRKNKKSRRLVERLGFTYEGMARRAYTRTEDAAIYSMLDTECRWING